MKSRSRFFFSCWDGAKGTVFCAPSFLFATARRRRFFLGAGKSKSGKLSRRDIFLQKNFFKFKPLSQHTGTTRARTGDCLSCGLGFRGRLGRGDEVHLSTPMRIAPPELWLGDFSLRAIAAGSDNSLSSALGTRMPLAHTTTLVVRNSAA